MPLMTLSVTTSEAFASPAVPPRQSMARFRLPTIVGLLGLHAVIGIAGYLVPTFATLHAGVVTVAAVGYSIAGRRIERVFAVVLYAGMCDVYWRMSTSRAPWELSKYLLAIGSVAILLRFTKSWHRPTLPVAFLCCLMPGVAFTLATVPLGQSRQLIASSEMGLISLGLCALAFRQLIINETDLWNVMWTMIGPLVCALSITLYSTLSAGSITFTDESNFAVTGGYGPNQVSSALGLGILLCVFLAFQRPGPKLLVLIAGLGLAFTWATFLTFSRGGLYSLVFAAGALVIVGVGTRGARARSVAMLVVGVIALVMVFNSVNNFSGNWLNSRYGENTRSTEGRTSLAEMDLRVFAGHPFRGVGTGLSMQYHEGGILRGAAAHTEFTRVVAEHGLFGLFAIVLLGCLLVSGIRQSRSQINRLLAAGAGVWALSTMLHAATRLAAVGLIFALTQLRVEPEDALDDQPATDQRRAG